VLEARLCKKNTVATSKKVKTGFSLAESSNKGYGFKRTVLPMMMVMIFISECSSEMVSQFLCPQ
jgi:hypothetical protein